MIHFARPAVLACAITALLAGSASAATYYRGSDGNPETLDQHKTSTVTEANILRDSRTHLRTLARRQAR